MQAEAMTHSEKLKTTDFDIFVDAIYELLCEVQLKDFPKGFAMGQKIGCIDWNISRERVYVVFPLLKFLAEHSSQFSFQRHAQSDRETIIDAMLLAIMRFHCFKSYNHDELLELYNGRISRRFPVWNKSLQHNLGITIPLDYQ